MLRVTHVAPCLINPPGELNGGVAGYIVGLARAQAQIGLKVRIVFPNIELGRRWPYARNWASGAVEAFCVGGSAIGGKWRHSVDTNVSNSDILHIHTPYSLYTEYAMFRAWRQGTPFITHTHGKLNPAFRKRRALAKTAWEQLLWRVTVKRSSFVLVSGQDERKLVYHALNYDVLPNGFDPVEFSHIPDSDLVKADRYLLFLGYLDPRKRIDLALRAFSLCADAGSRFIVAGPDSYGIQSELERLCEDLGISNRVDFTGAVAGAKKIELLGRARALVLLSEGEGMANVMLEAMGMCTPIVFSKGCVFSDLDALGGGLQVSDDPVKIAKAFEAVLSDETLRISMRSALRNMQTRYTWLAIASRSLDLYHAALSPK